MNDPRERIRHWLLLTVWAALGLGVLCPLSALVVDRLWGREVLLIAPHDPRVVALNRSLWSPGEPVATIYGNPMSEAVRVLILRPEKVLHPQEDQTLSLLAVDGTGVRPIQSRTLWFFARWIVMGATVSLVLAAIGVVLLRAPRAK